MITEAELEEISAKNINPTPRADVVGRLIAELRAAREGIQALIDSGPDTYNFCRFCGCHECHQDDCPAGKLLPSDW